MTAPKTIIAGKSDGGAVFWAQRQIAEGIYEVNDRTPMEPTRYVREDISIKSYNALKEIAAGKHYPKEYAQKILKEIDSL